MIILGLAGQAGCGKSTVAEYLVRRYGFVKFAFSDALYDEVQQAFGLEDQSLLRDWATKDARNRDLSLSACRDDEFVRVGLNMMEQQAKREGGEITLPRRGRALPPRQILQWWGTEYRRTQNPDYWIDAAQRRLMATTALYPEQQPQHFVEAGTRFENERDWIKYGDALMPYSAWSGNIWHIHRGATDKFNDSHASAAPLPVLEGERELWNNDTIERLHSGIDLLMSTSARFVRVEPIYGGPWCCEKAVPLGQATCPEREETSAGYQTAMSPPKETT